MSRKDGRIAELEAQLQLSVQAVGRAQVLIAELHSMLAERDAAFEPLKAEAAELKHENERLRREFKGFLDSITFWQGEL